MGIAVKSGSYQNTTDQVNINAHISNLIIYNIHQIRTQCHALHPATLHFSRIHQPCNPISAVPMLPPAYPRLTHHHPYLPNINTAAQLNRISKPPYPSPEPKTNDDTSSSQCPSGTSIFPNTC
jgi:hypothetical protein